MIDYANYLLNQWALWCLTGREKLGYPNHAAFLNMQPPSGKRNPLMVTDEQAMKVQRAVASLPPELRPPVELYYLKMRMHSPDQIAQRMRCSRSTFFRKLHSAQQHVMREIDAGSGAVDARTGA